MRQYKVGDRVVFDTTNGSAKFFGFSPVLMTGVVTRLSTFFGMSVTYIRCDFVNKEYLVFMDDVVCMDNELERAVYEP